MRFPVLIVCLLTVVAALCADDSLADQIRAAQSAGRYADASRLYLELIAAGNDNPEIRSNCGVMLQLAGKNREALDQFRVALHSQPQLPAANLFAGLAEFDLGHPQAALPFLVKARQLDPARPAPLLALGKVYVALHRYDQASEVFSKAASLNSKLAEAWYGLGVTDRSRAEEILNRASRSGVAVDQATKSKIEKLLDGAVKALTRAAELDPDSARTHLLMAEALADQGKLAQAIPEYHAALELQPSLDAARLGLATQYWKNRQFDQARPLLERVLAQSPKDPEANAMLADILEHDGATASALRRAQIALSGNPNLIQTRVVAARIYLKDNQPALAIQQLRQVLSADPDGSYHFLLYRAYRQAGDQQEAKAALAEFQRLRNKSAPN